MKKVCAFFLAICLAAGLCACSSTSSSYDYEWTTDASGNKISSSDTRWTIFPDSLPVSMEMNGAEISLASVDLYQDKSEENHEYTLWIVATIETAGMSSDDLYWLQKSDLDVSSYITCEGNGYDFDSANRLGSLRDESTGEIVYVFTSSFFNENRYSFAGSELVVSASETDKDGIYKSIHYSFDVGDDLQSAETISEPLYGYMAKWLKEESNAYSDLLK